MKATAIRKIFGKQEKLQGGIGLALSLIQGLTQYDWEAAWPGIQRAMIGLGAAAIAALKAESIAKGIPGLAERIASFGGTIDVSGNVQDESRTQFGDLSVPAPYMPIAMPDSIVGPAATLNRDVDQFMATPPKPPHDPCRYVAGFRRSVENLYDRFFNLADPLSTGVSDVLYRVFVKISELERKYDCPDDHGMRQADRDEMDTEEFL